MGGSPNGKWIYIGFADKGPDGEARQLTLIVNARTLKLDKVLAHTGGQNLHYTIDGKFTYVADGHGSYVSRSITS